MAKAGRKRKQRVVRQPDGTPRNERGTDPRVIAARQPHRQGVALDIVHDPAAESNFGKLMLQRHITYAQYQSGVKWRGIVQRYRAVICAPRCDVVSLSGVIVGPWGGSGEIDNDTALDRKAKYNAAFEALSGAGNRATRAVNHWAVYDRPDYALGDLIRGLIELCEHFGLTKGSVCSSAINRR